MKTISNYLKEYGKYTFMDKGFNEVDNVILSILSYVDFYGIVPSTNNGSITLKEASKEFYKKYSKKDIKTNIISVRDASKILAEIASTKRFKDLELLNYEYYIADGAQFGALCIKLPNKNLYISFEGTDAYVSGWEEDFMLSYKFPTKAQELAIEYLNNVVRMFGPRVYVGGQSKGGHLALIAAMYWKKYVYYKIKAVYSNDGPGVRMKEYESDRYNRVLNKYYHIVPEDSFFGRLFTNDNNYIIVKSAKSGMFQHNAVNWCVEGDHLKRSSFSKFSNRFKRAMDTWLSHIEDTKKEEFSKLLFSIFKEAGVDDLCEVKKSMLPNIAKLIKQTKNMTKEEKDFITATLKDLYNEWKG